VITNIVKPNFQLLKNEELEETLVNDIMNAFSKIANITIYYSLGISLFVYNYLNKINNMTLWMMLIITMLSHLCILHLLYKRLISKKIWDSWEGI
jgi:capsule polysaccharide modification protein KpsS